MILVNQIQRFFDLHWSMEIDINQNPTTNMALDEAAAKHCLQNPTQAFLRLYSWSPWAVSLGAHQNINHIDTNRCQDLGFSVVRRPTGGRAVLHAHELTYSVAVMTNTVMMSHHDVYHIVHHCLLEALHHCGFTNLGFEKSQPKFSELYAREVSSALCFSSSARYEVMWAGKKIIGSAQKLYRHNDQTVVLQHGSILLGPGHEQLADLLVVPSVEQQKHIKQQLMERSITLEQLSQKKVEFIPIAQSILNVFLEKQHQAGT